MIFIGDVWLKPEEVMQVRVERALMPTGVAGVFEKRARVEVDPFDCKFPWEDEAIAEVRRDDVAYMILEAYKARRILGEDE